MSADRWLTFVDASARLGMTVVLLYPQYTGTDPLILLARGIASLDVTAFVSQ